MKKPVKKFVALAAGVIAILGAIGGYLVSLPHVSVSDAKVAGGTVTLTIKNSGGTVAHDATLREPIIFFGSYPPKPGALAILPDAPCELASGQEVVFTRTVQITNARMFQQHEAAIYAFGTVEYVDWLGMKHQEAFGLFYLYDPTFQSMTIYPLKH